MPLIALIPLTLFLPKGLYGSLQDFSMARNPAWTQK
jgi:hypothetical protein